MLLRAAALMLPAACLATSNAQGPGDEVADPIQFLRAEVSVARTLFQPSQPIPIRFTLFNPTAEPVELPVAWRKGDKDGIKLPQALIIGSPDQPALFVTYEGDRPTPVRPEPRGGEHGPTDVLRLAPRASVGAQLDISSVHRLMRYSGDYRLEWQPLGGRVAPVSVSFRVEPRKDAVLVTDFGKITFSLMYDQAPHNVENFLELVRERFYDGKTIHRVIPGFIIQGGSPDGSASGIRPDGRLVAGEFHNAPFEAGTLAMARKPRDPDSASCQFFISLARLEELDGKYTVIGQARGAESLRTLQQIAELPTNNRDQPIRPLTIRFFTLVEKPVSEVRQLDSPKP